MRSWRGFLRAILVGPWLVILGAKPERGANRPLAVAVVIIQILIFMAAVCGLFWPPLLFWLVKPFIAVQDWLGVGLALALCGTLGAAFVLVAVWSLIGTAILVMRGRRTTATVLSASALSEDPKFQFTDAQGQTHEVSGEVVRVAGRRGFGTGEHVPLIYLPQRPTTFVVDRFRDKWGSSLIYLFLGLILLLVCSVFLFDLKQFLLRSVHIGPIVFLTLGVGMLYLGVTNAAGALRFRKNAAKSVGVIVESRSERETSAEKYRKEGKILHALSPPQPGEPEPWLIAVEFTDATGAKRQATTQVHKAAGRKAYEVGEQLPIRYDTQRPWDIRLRGQTFLHWFGAVAATLLGAAFVAGGLFLAFVYGR